MRSLGVAMLVIALAACGSSESSSTTATPADPPTTIAPTTSVAASSVPATTVLVTTAPPTTIVSTTAAPAATLAPTAAEQEILARLDAFNAGFDTCLADAQTCDEPAFLDEFVAEDDPAIRTLVDNAWNYYLSSDLVAVSDGRIDYSVASIQVNDDGLSGWTHSCEVNRSFDAPRPEATVAPTTAPTDPEIVYAQYYFEWAKQPDGRWLITHSEWTFGWTPNDMSEGEMPSLSPQDLAQCFA